MNYGWRFVTLYRNQESRPPPRKRNAKKKSKGVVKPKSSYTGGNIIKWYSYFEEVKSKGEKERYKHLNAEFQRIARRDKKAFLMNYL